MKTAIFTSLIVLGLQFAAVSAYSQIVPYKKWEIGAGIRPLNFEENPYSIIVKRHLGLKWAIRLGGSFMAQSDQTVDYTLIPRIFKEETVLKRVDEEFKQNSIIFSGIQFFFRIKQLNFYTGVDLFALHLKHDNQYEYQKYDNFPGGFALQPGEVFFTPQSKTQKSVGLGISPFIGIIWQINTSYSLQFESSYYLATFSTNGYYARAVYENRFGSDIGYDSAAGLGEYGINDRSTDWGFSPLSFLSFNYHF